jgi:hypothetical protein
MTTFTFLAMYLNDRCGSVTARHEFGLPGEAMVNRVAIGQNGTLKQPQNRVPERGHSRLIGSRAALPA